ncbi:MAG: hypothetical protein AB8D78_10075 [Akkermansiaceae bacterium]
MKHSLLPILLALFTLMNPSNAEVIEVFEDEDGMHPPKSGAYLWIANPGILSKSGKSVIQTNPNPKTMRMQVSHDIKTGELEVKGDGQKMTMLPVSKDGSLPWKGNAKTKALSATDIALVAGKAKVEELPCWTGKQTTQEGVSVSYSLVQVMDDLFIGQMTGKRNGLTFHRSFLLKPVSK